MTDLIALIDHPENMSKDTLYDLRSLLALHPTYQAARLLLLQNLYLLHDPSFEDELRHAAISLADRTRIFQLIEAAHYQLRSDKPAAMAPQTQAQPKAEDRTTSLIDSFLDTVPQEQEENKGHKRKPTALDATTDYMAYLMETEGDEQQDEEEPKMQGQSLIDNFLNSDEANGRIKLNDNPEYEPEDSGQDSEDDEQSDYFTETLAKIYIAQGRYSKALEIIKRLNLIYPKKNRYFADQMRFLEKLIINNKQSKE